MRITFHLTQGMRLDRRVEFDNGMVFYQSISRGWYNLTVVVELPDSKNEISESAATEELIKQYRESSVEICWFEAQERLYEFDLRQIGWRAAAA